MDRYSKRDIARAFLVLRGERGQVTAMAAIANYVYATHRTHELELIVEEIAVALLAKGHLLVRATTARPLSAQLKKELVKHLKKITEATTVSLEYAVNPALLGGIDITLPTGTIDTTIAHRLNQLA